MSARPTSRGAVSTVLVVWLAAGPAHAQPVGAEASLFGMPLAGATASELARFEAGATAFARDRRNDPGFGPLFNGFSCGACHRKPALGGAGALYNRVLHAGVVDAGGSFHVAPGRPSSVVHRFLVRSPVEADGGLENVPPEANAFSMRQPTLLFGLGLVEAIPASRLLAHADPDDADGDGISGRAAFEPGVIGRFGIQSQSTSLRAFVETAFREEHGLEAGEIPPGDLDRIVDFVRLLQPPPRREVPGADEGASVFEEIGCAGCHVPSFVTSRKPYRTAAGEVIDSRALRSVSLHPYSDFLLHDMGPELDDGVALGDAETYEYRTAPLWGWRYRPGLLHDARAQILDTAMRFHGGEAADSRAAYLALSVRDRQLLMALMLSL
jgi:CxxC motif-containing protein (DUF1111 family)